VRKRLVFLAIIMCLMVGSITFAENNDNKFVAELKQWDWSLGGYAYLYKARASYLSVGVKRDLGQFFNALDNEKLYVEAGYLNSKIFDNEAEKKDQRKYGFAGLSTNANFVVQQGIKGINKLVDGNFSTPKLLDSILTTIGIIGAKKMDETFYQPFTGWDYGINIAIIKQW